MMVLPVAPAADWPTGAAGDLVSLEERKPSGYRTGLMRVRTESAALPNVGRTNCPPLSADVYWTRVGRRRTTVSQVFEIIGAPYGTRTRVSAVKGRCPRPLDEGR